MNVMRLSTTIVKDFVTHNPFTGASQDADATPYCEIFEGTSDTPILTPAVTKRTNRNGNYRIQVALTPANGFELSKSYNIVARATVLGITAKEVIDSFVIESLAKQSGLVVADAGNSVSQFKTNLTQTDNDYWKDALCLICSGNLAGQVKKVSGYDGTTKVLTFATPFTGVVSASDNYELINF